MIVMMSLIIRSIEVIVFKVVFFVRIRMGSFTFMLIVIVIVIVVMNITVR